MCDRDGDGTSDGWYQFYGDYSPTKPVYWHLSGVFSEADYTGDGTIDLISESFDYRGYRRLVVWLDEDRDGTVEGILVDEAARNYIHEIELEYYTRKRASE